MVIATGFCSVLNETSRLGYGNDRRIYVSSFNPTLADIMSSATSCGFIGISKRKKEHITKTARKKNEKERRGRGRGRGREMYI